MKEEDNIEKFFGKRLEEHAPADDGWNIPSDDIWNKAKVHFPKEEVKKKPLFMLWLGLGSVILLLGGLFINYNFQKENINTAIEAQRTEAIGAEQIQKLGDELTTTTSQTATDRLEEEERNNTISSLNIDKVINENNTEIVEKKASSNFTANERAAQEIIVHENIIEKKDGNLEQFVKIEAVASKTRGIVELESEENPLGEKKSEKAIALVSEAREVFPLEAAIPKSEEVQMDEKELPTFEQIEIKPERKLNRWEIGLSHAPLLFKLDDLLSTDSVGVDESFSAAINYFNLNLPVTRRFNRKWSLSSGLMYSQFDFGIDFTSKEEYQTQTGAGQLRSVIQDQIVFGSVNLDDEFREVAVEFLNNVMLNNGDELEIVGSIPLRLSILQIPVMANYHFGKGKWEGLIQAGVALDYFEATLRGLDVEVFKEGILISKPMEFDPFSDSGLGLSVYTGVGFKYHLNNRLNIGLSTKFDVAELFLSRGEIGIYYGF